MSDTDTFKLLEVGLLLAALIGFVWWQRRDLERARRDTARQREQEREQAQAADGQERAP